MAAAAADAATVFLETSLGTRFVVSFPASATTVADLKRRVSAEHAACFPQIGPIAVKSLQVKYDGALFYLADSMAVSSAFRWVKGPWQLRVGAHELQSHSLAREDADGGNGDSEQNAGNHVVRATKQNTSSPASSQGGGNLAVGDGFSGNLAVGDGFSGNLAVGDGVSCLRLLKNQLDEHHDGVERASDQLKDEDTVPQESSDLYLAAGGSATRAMEQQDQSHDGVKHASVQGRDGNVKTMLMGSSDLYFAAVGSENPVDLQDKSPEGVKHASGQHKDGNVMTMLQESSDLDLATSESDTGAKNQLNKSHEDVQHTSSLCENGNAYVAAGEDETPSMNQLEKSYEGVKHASGQRKSENVDAMVQEKSKNDAAAGESESSPMNMLEKSYEGVKHASGQRKGENVDAMVQEKSENDAAAGESESPPMNMLEKSYEGVKHASGQHEHENVTIVLDESSDSDVAASESETLPVNQLDTSHKDVRHASGQREDGTVNIMLQKRSDLDESAAGKDSSPMQSQQKDVIAEPTGAKCFIKEDKNDENTIANCDDNIFGGRLCIRSMKKGKKRPASNDQFLEKRKDEGVTSSVSKEQAPCFKRRQRIVTVRKLPMSRAAKIYGFRC